MRWLLLLWALVPIQAANLAVKMYLPGGHLLDMVTAVVLGFVLGMATAVTMHRCITRKDHG